MTLEKYFSHPSLVIYFFPTQTGKTKTGTANKWKTINSKPTRPFREWQSYHIHYTLLWKASLRKLCQNACSKSILLSQTTIFDFSSSKFIVQSHILSTAGDALRDEVFLSLIAFSKVLLATTDNNRYLKSLTMTSSPMPKSSTMVPSVSLQSLVGQAIWRLSR